jgi:hypothetical protein
VLTHLSEAVSTTLPIETWLRLSPAVGVASGSGSGDEYSRRLPAPTAAAAASASASAGGLARRRRVSTDGGVAVTPPPPLLTAGGARGWGCRGCSLGFSARRGLSSIVGAPCASTCAAGEPRARTPLHVRSKRPSGTDHTQN